jgi:hypothetical protein
VHMARRPSWIMTLGMLLTGSGTALVLLLVEGPYEAVREAVWYHGGYALGSMQTLVGMVLGMSLAALGWRATGWLRRRAHARPIAQKGPPTAPASIPVEQAAVVLHILDEVVRSVRATEATTRTGDRASVAEWTRATDSTVILVAALSVADSVTRARPAAVQDPLVPTGADPGPSLATGPMPEQDLARDQQLHMCTNSAPSIATGLPDHEDAADEVVHSPEESGPQLSIMTDNVRVEHHVTEAGAVVNGEGGGPDGVRALASEVTLEIAKTGYVLDAWTTDDRALACATLVQRLLMAHAVPNGIIALDVADRHVRVFLDLPPTSALSVEQLAHTLGAEQATWHVWADQSLMITLPEAPSLPHGPWPSLLPVLALDSKARAVRYVLASRWPHVGVYGGSALAVTHALLTMGICYSSPQTLGLQFLDPHHLIDAVYEDAPHTVRSAIPASQMLEQIIRDVQRSMVDDLRMLMLVMVEPDPPLMPLLASLLRLIRQQPRIPLRVLVAQPTVHSTGREVYSMLAGIVTAQGVGQAALIPGLHGWPRPGRAVVFQQRAQWEGFPMTMDEGDAREVVRSLPRGPYMLPPVIGAAERSAAAKRLAAVVATAGREASDAAPVAVPRDVRTQPTAIPQQAAAAPSPVPTEPPMWSDADLTVLVTCLTTESTLMGGQHPGVTRGRLQHVLPEHLKSQARLVLLWLDAAELLVPPIKPEEPYRHPRPLRSRDPVVVSAALRATPLPDHSGHLSGDGA